MILLLNLCTLQDFKVHGTNQMTNKKISTELKRILTGIANQIAELRHKLDYTQKKLARQANLNPFLISRIENIQCKDISVETLIKIARALHARLEIKFI